jgi:uncharacterized protein YggE
VNVVGEAERQVVPDRVVVTVSIRTPTLPTPAEALALGIVRRARVREALAAAVPGAAVSDARVTTSAEHEHVEEPDARGRVVSRSVVRGHYGVCELRVEDAAGRAGAIMGAAGAHPDVAAATPGFAIGADLRRAVERELEQEAVRDALVRGAGLAEAAGMRCGEVLVIGDPPAAAEPYERGIVLAELRMEAGALEDAIGELVPEARTLSARVPVSLALLPGG